MSRRVRSNKVPVLYFYSSWAVVCLAILMLFALTPWSKQVESLRGIKPLLYLLGGTVGVVGVPASIIIFLGMVVFCVRGDPSPIHVKILWFILFFATAMFGAVVYFFTVYLRQVRDAIPSASRGIVPTADRPAGSTEIPGQHDLLAGISRHAIAEPSYEHEMRRIPTFLLRAKHWQLFLLLAAPVATMQFLGLSFMSINVSSWHDLVARDYLVIAIWELAALCVLAWLGSMGLLLSSMERSEFRMNTRFFCISIATAALFLVIDIPNLICKGSGFSPIVESLSPLWMVGMVYIVYFVSKSFGMAQRGVRVSFDQYVGWFFLLWFFPIGVWIIQPRINRLFRNKRVAHQW